MKNYPIIAVISVWRSKARAKCKL